MRGVRCARGIRVSFVEFLIIEREFRLVLHFIGRARLRPILEGVRKNIRAGKVEELL